MQQTKLPLFKSYIGIDYSGAKTAGVGLTGLRVYMADAKQPAREVLPPQSRSKYWSRRGIAHWLRDQINRQPATIIGIDHGFSFPRAYFDQHGIAHDWHVFLDDFCAHWPLTQDDISVDHVREGLAGRGAKRFGNTRWRRMCEVRAGGAKSVFHFDVTGSVAKSTHAGLPWLQYLRDTCGDKISFWPFDGWRPQKNRAVVAEVYPSLWHDRYPVRNRTPDQHDAYSIATFLRDNDLAGSLAPFLQPPLSAEEKQVAVYEGWILGVF